MKKCYSLTPVVYQNRKNFFLKSIALLCFAFIFTTTITAQIQQISTSGSHYHITGENFQDTIITFTLNNTDSVLSVANSLIEENYTVPSWTLLRRAIVTATALKDSTSTVALQIAINNLKSKEMPYNINSTLNKDPKTNLGFAWFTNVGVTGGIVEIVEGTATDYNAFDTPTFSLGAKCDSVINLNYCNSLNDLANLAGIPNDTKKCYMSNKALAKGLTPNTTYSYRVGKPNAWSEIGTFKTAPNNTAQFSFIYITDTQADTDEMFYTSQMNTHTAQNMYPNANFWLSCGDLVESNGEDNSEWEYEQFFETQQDIFLKKPFAPIVGNHEYSPNRNFTRHFNTDSIGFDYTNSSVPGSVYSFVYGDALFLALSFETYYSNNYMDSISTWMRNQVAANPSTKWRIAFFHRPIYTGGSHQPEPDLTIIRDAMAPVFDELKIDLALQGHDHIYEVIGPIKNKQLDANAVSNVLSVPVNRWTNLTGKAGGIFNVNNGTLYFLNGHAGTKEYGPYTQQVMDSVESELGITNYFGMFSGRFGQTNNPSFSYITVSTDTINIKTYTVSYCGLNQLYDNIKVVKFTDIETENKKTSLGKQNEISIYPLPVKDFAYININNPAESTVEIYSLNGKLIKSENINGSTAIDLQNLPQSTYILKVNKGNGSYSVKFTKE